MLEVRDLQTSFRIDGKEAPVVDGVTFEVGKSEIVALVGESGCGKSVTALSIMNLIADPPGKIRSGRIIFEGEDLLERSEKQLRKIRGRRLSMIFQDPMMSLNPVQTIGRQISEAIEQHERLGRKQALERAQELLRLIGMPSSEYRISNYPHQLSGGMKQRVMIAMAISCNPCLIIADEPTTALDVTVQAQIMDTMRHLRESKGMAILLITHDLGIVAEIAERILVMYAGQIVESASVLELFTSPRHPYTKGLLTAVPRPDIIGNRLHAIKGTIPKPSDFLSGCRFHPRCEYAGRICMERKPLLRKVGDNHTIRCWAATENYVWAGADCE